MGETLRGAAVVKAIAADLLPRVAALKERRIFPKLAIVRVGDKPDDLSYQKGAVSRCEAVGVAVEIHAFREDVTRERLAAGIAVLNRDAHVHGVLVLRPLPAHIPEETVSAALAPEKDVDGITDASLAGVLKHGRRGFAPCTAEACIEMLCHYGISVAGKRAVVIGRSLVVGKPVALMLTAMDATVTVCHTKTAGIEEIARGADLLVVAAGRREMVGRAFVKPGAAVIDVGINAAAAGRIAGDVDFDGIIDIAGAATPVPGGVGGVTAAVLAKHTVEAAERGRGGL